MPDLITDLFFATNLKGEITKYDLNLATLVLHKATLLATVPEVCMSMPHSGSDNTHTILWSTRMAFTINPVVADLLRIRTLLSRQFSLNLPIFYHPGQGNCMAEDTS